MCIIYPSPASRCKPKTQLFASFLLLFVPFCSFLFLCNMFLAKNVKNAYFNQRLECAAPKQWSKYTTYYTLTQTRDKRQEKEKPSCFNYFYILLYLLSVYKSKLREKHKESINVARHTGLT